MVSPYADMLAAAVQKVRARPDGAHTRLVGLKLGFWRQGDRLRAQVVRLPI